MGEAWALLIEDEPACTDESFVFNRLAAYNRTQVGDDHHRKLDIFVRDEAGAIRAGLLGDTYWGWLHVAILWVDDPLRGQGYGTRLLAASEQEARRRGCQQAHLDTMSFQALPFYLERGYAIWGQLDDAPPGHMRYYL
jgi:GNAT superfamily N-acetyltransferase